jgi:SAM-dependent methyltransferase
LIHTEIIQQIEMQVPAGSLLLEIGAQRGVDAAVLADKGYRVVTLDYSNESVSMMRATYQDRLMTVQGDIRHLPFRSDAFALVYSQGLLEHFFQPDLGTIMLEQRRVISPKGHVLIDVPNLFSPLTIPKHILMVMRRYVLPQEWQYSWRALRRIGRRYGLVYERHYSWGYDRLIGRPLVRLLDGLPAIL